MDRSGHPKIGFARAESEMHMDHPMQHTQVSSGERKVCTGMWLWSQHHALGCETTGMDGAPQGGCAEWYNNRTEKRTLEPRRHCAQQRRTLFLERSHREVQRNQEQCHRCHVIKKYITWATESNLLYFCLYFIFFIHLFCLYFKNKKLQYFQRVVLNTGNRTCNQCIYL